MSDSHRKTALHDACLAAGAKMAPFAGWSLPLHFGSQIAEHRAVRAAAGLFDVSHMAVFDVDGPGALPLLRRVLAGDAARLTNEGQALYTLMLNESAGIIDDLLAYRHGDGYRLVANAANRQAVGGWLKDQRRSAVTVTERDLAMLALQGPKALALFEDVHGAGADRLKPFHAMALGDWMVARTGYTGEAGLEIILPNADAPGLWSCLIAAGAAPAGLGARDTLRLEAGLKLHGQDMGADTTPLEAGLQWTVHRQPEERPFIGREALAAQAAEGAGNRIFGLLLQGRGVLRGGQRVFTAAGEGVITSGIFSPTLGYSIAFARLPSNAAGAMEVLIRGKRQQARLVRPPFVRGGRPAFQELN
ncbi:MAG: glycine cleavage system aminomethyltransferase GcvT [Gammaproteobacteria bacterium]|nr:glycine cleavage system aminomethyltransferase GcvT [Gammaproteobacteria bacterium]